MKKAKEKSKQKNWQIAIFLLIASILLALSLATMLCHGQVAFAEERGNDLAATTSSSEDTFYEIYSLDVANTTKLVQDVNNRISYYNTFSGYYLLQFATANAPITMNVNVLEDGIDYDDQFEIVSLPSFTDIEGNINAFKFYMSANKYYDIDVLFSNVYVGQDNSIDAIVTLSSWKAFKSIKARIQCQQTNGRLVPAWAI